jgi:hypothetical protein
MAVNFDRFKPLDIGYAMAMVVLLAEAENGTRNC